MHSKAYISKDDAKNLEQRIASKDIEIPFEIDYIYYFKNQPLACIFASVNQDELAIFLEKNKYPALKIEEAKRYSIDSDESSIDR